MSDSDPDYLWVMDTSSILFIKHRIKPHYRSAHLDQLAQLGRDGHIICPPKVISELTNVKRPDQFSAWAKSVKGRVCRYGGCQQKMQEAMAERAVAQCIEHLESAGNADPADPWVIAHALHVRDDKGIGVTIVTDERAQYRKARSSLNIAAGAFGFPAINYETMVARLATWDDDHLV